MMKGSSDTQNGMEWVRKFMHCWYDICAPLHSILCTKSYKIIDGWPFNQTAPWQVSKKISVRPCCNQARIYWLTTLLA